MFDAKKLEALRAKYGNVGGDVMFSEESQRVAAVQFSAGGRRNMPFAGVPTFLDAEYRADAQDLPDFGGLDIAMVGVPMDLGVTNRAGSRFGPRAVRTIERIGPYEHFLKVVPLAEAKVADIGDVPFRSRFSLESCHEDIEAFYTKLCTAGIVPLSVGGDHSISQSILAGVAKRHGPVGMVHFDAHCDTSGPYEGSKFQHGGPFREAVLAGHLNPERTVQIGIRGPAEYLWDFSYDAGMTVIHAEDVTRMGTDTIIETVRKVVGDGPTYISLDVDCLDPVFAPGTGTPEIGGMTSREVLAIMRGIAGINAIGGDVVEVAPQYDATTNTAQLGAQMLFEILCLLVLNLQARRD
ncbi:MAG: agmatinase [Zavarzinia sp.]|nr:agmatinase [Zavarzinia sp.]